MSCGNYHQCCVLDLALLCKSIRERDFCIVKLRWKEQGGAGQMFHFEDLEKALKHSKINVMPVTCDSVVFHCSYVLQGRFINK